MAILAAIIELGNRIEERMDLLHEELRDENLATQEMLEERMDLLHEHMDLLHEELRDENLATQEMLEERMDLLHEELRDENLAIQEILEEQIIHLPNLEFVRACNKSCTRDGDLVMWPAPIPAGAGVTRSYLLFNMTLAQVNMHLGRYRIVGHGNLQARRLLLAEHLGIRIF